MSATIRLSAKEEAMLRYFAAHQGASTPYRLGAINTCMSLTRKGLLSTWCGSDRGRNHAVTKEGEAWLAANPQAKSPPEPSSG